MNFEDFQKSWQSQDAAKQVTEREMGALGGLLGGLPGL